MKIAFHIAHYQSPGRNEFLRQVLVNLAALPHDVAVFIYTNDDLPGTSSHAGMQINVIKVKFYNFIGSRRFLSLVKTLSHNAYVAVAQHIQPFYLTWVNRRFVAKVLDDFDVQVYMEDDISFTERTLRYWQQYSPVCIANGYNLGFLLVERNELDERIMCQALWEEPTKTVEIQGGQFLLNDVNPYCAFWIYGRDELRRFTRSEEWNFKFKGYGVRERSAIGWHGEGMNRYKGTVIPLIENTSGDLAVNEDCAVHHLPNNYIGHAKFCKVAFPIKCGKH